MWRKLKNIVISFSTYADLGPDVRLRRQVSRFLCDRPCLNADTWFEFWQSLNVSRQVSDFVYVKMSQYSGLEFARVRPSDRLVEDLHLPLVCWFDWELRLSEDFYNCFGVDLCDRFDLRSLPTVKELVVFLDRQLLPVNHS